MKKETIGEKEINLSHDLSGRLNIRKEKLGVREGLCREGIIINNLKTA